MEKATWALDWVTRVSPGIGGSHETGHRAEASIFPTPCAVAI